MSSSLVFVQVRELLKKNYIEDRRNPKRTLCEHLCPLLIAVGLGYGIGAAQTEADRFSSSRSSGPAMVLEAGVYHQLDYTYVHDPMTRIFSKTERSGSSFDPCKDCSRPIVLQGPPGEQFKSFLEKRLQNGNFGHDVCGLDSIVTGKTVNEMVGKGNGTCAAIVWPGDDPGVYAVRTNRTYGFMDKDGRYDAYPSAYSYGGVWEAQQDAPVSAAELKASRCTSKAATAKCKSAFNKLYGPPVIYKSSYSSIYSRGPQYLDTALEDPWFVALDLLVHEFLEDRWYSKGNKLPALDFHKDVLQNNKPKPTEYMVVASPVTLSEADVKVINDNAGQSFSSSQAAGIGIMMGIWLSLVSIMNFFTLISRTIKEREEKIKEGLRMMGTSNTAYYGHWLVYSWISSLLHSFFVFAAWSYFSVFKRFYISFFIFAFVFYANIHAFALLFACFFSSPRNGALIGTMLFLLCTFLSMMPVSGGADFLMMLIPQVTWTKYMIALKTGDAEDWPDDLEIDGGLTMGACQFWMFFDCFLLHFLWIYFDMVIPHENSSNQTPWYLCDPGYWKGTQGVVDGSDPSSLPAVELGEVTPGEMSSSSRSPELGQSDPAAHEPMVVRERRSVDETLSDMGRAALFEPPSAEDLENIRRERCVTVKDLCVYFKGVHGEEIKAVNNVNLFMNPGEVFCLLGHNGAGKSTTMSVIAGMLKCTRGQVTVFGKRVPQEMAIVRKKMGFCPQHDVLFADLTVRQHIELFSKLTGRAGAEQATLASMLDLVKAVGLGDRANFVTTELSGGMKRKLSVGITFSGDPNLVILDEPTSGMDPFSRRVLWDFLKLRKEGRVLLLTTHFMDEADVLGDRIAIMRAGEVQTCGSSQFLKRKFGCGYVLTVVMSEDKKDLHGPVKDLISKTVQDDRIEFSAVGKEILANIPFDRETELPATLDALGREKDTLKVATFGISLTNLEEVFLKVASGDHGSKEQKEETNRSFMQESQRHEDNAEAAFVMPNPGGTIPEQMFALLLRRQQSAVRDMKAFTVGCVVPILMVLGACMLGKLFITKNVPSSQPLPAVEIKLTDPQVYYAFASLDPPPAGLPSHVKFLGRDCGKKFEESFIKDGYSFFCQRKDGSSYSRGEATPQKCDFKTMAKDAMLPKGFLEYCEQKKKAEMSEYKAASYCRGFFFQALINFDECLAESGNHDFGALLVDGFPVVSLNNSHVAHATPLAIKELFEWTGAGSVTVSTDILERTTPEKEWLTRTSIFFQAIANILIAVLSNFAFCFVPIAVLGFVLMEKAKDVKHQLLISGCSAKAYWVSMLIWDCLIGAIPVIMLYVFLWFFGFEAFIRYAAASCSVLLLFVPAAVSLAYVLTHVINGPNVGNSCLLVCNGICGLLLVALFLVADVMSKGIPILSAFNMEDPESRETPRYLAEDEDVPRFKPSPNDPIMKYNTSQYQQDFLYGRCSGIQSAYNKIVKECRATEYNGYLRDYGKCNSYGRDGNKYYYAQLRNFKTMNYQCPWVWRLGVAMTTTKIAGSILPGFNLLDGLARIAGRHALIYLMLPQGVRQLGSYAERFIGNQIDEMASACGSPMQPKGTIEGLSEAEKKKRCESYKVEAQEITQKLKEKGQTCALPFFSSGGGGAGINPFSGEFVVDHIVKHHPDEASRDLLRHALNQRAEEVIGRRLDGSGNMTGLEANDLSEIVTKFLMELLMGADSPLRKLGETGFLGDPALQQLVECVASPEVDGGIFLALNALLSGHGKNFGAMVKDWFNKMAASPDFTDFADRMLPTITTRKKDLFGGECVWGPEFGPWVFGKILPKGFAASMPSLNKTSFGPLRVTMPCDFGLSGNDAAKGIGGILEVLVLLPTVGDSLLRLTILAIVYTILAIVIEDLKQSPRFAMWMANKEPCPDYMLSLEDENVKAEKERVAKVDSSRQIMYVNRLRKVFGGGIFGGRSTHAVRGVTWAADKGMVFGLLGVNGAGKTTSFKMMSGILTPSDGEVRILGINVLHETARARRFIGYCPQFDALIERLTVIEHLRLYARMKGLKGVDLTKAVDTKLTEMQLKMYTTRRSGSLSGGNKRKLSVAMAIIGEPPVIFLDEPSTGMDPFARRFMWGVIQDVAEKRKQSVVVLTTHSMEEAEALCSCIAIQVDGQLRCLGSAQQLKSQYGHGYEISVKFAPVTEELLISTAAEWSITDLSAMVSKQAAQQTFNSVDVKKASACVGHTGPFPDGPDNIAEVNARILIEWSILYDKLHAFEAFLTSPDGAKQEEGSVNLIEAHGLSAKWRLTDMVEMGLAQLMKDVQATKAQSGISDFACNQASLEQIFNAFAAQQESRAEGADARSCTVVPVRSPVALPIAPVVSTAGVDTSSGDSPKELFPLS